MYFALRIQQKIMSDILHRVRRGRCSIRIALTKLDFNVHAVSSCICKQCHGLRKKLDHLPQNLKVFTDFFGRQLRCKRGERATLFSVEKSLQETTSFNLRASQRRSQRNRKLKRDNPLGPSPLRQSTWLSMRALTGGKINIVTGFFQRREAIHHWCRLIY